MLLSFRELSKLIHIFEDCEATLPQGMLCKMCCCAFFFSVWLEEVGMCQNYLASTGLPTNFQENGALTQFKKTEPVWYRMGEPSYQTKTHERAAGSDRKAKQRRQLPPASYFISQKREDAHVCTPQCMTMWSCNMHFYYVRSGKKTKKQKNSERLS